MFQDGSNRGHYCGDEEASWSETSRRTHRVGRQSDCRLQACEQQSRAALFLTLVPKLDWDSSKTVDPCLLHPHQGQSDSEERTPYDLVPCLHSSNTFQLLTTSRVYACSALVTGIATHKSTCFRTFDPASRHPSPDETHTPASQLHSFASKPFHVLLTLSTKFFSTFPHGTCLLSV